MTVLQLFGGFTIQIGLNKNQNQRTLICTINIERKQFSFCVGTKQFQKNDCVIGVNHSDCYCTIDEVQLSYKSLLHDM